MTTIRNPTNPDEPESDGIRWNQIKGRRSYNLSGQQCLIKINRYELFSLKQYYSGRCRIVKYYHHFLSS